MVNGRAGEQATVAVGKELSLESISWLFLPFDPPQARELVSACFSNIALCLLKAQRFQDAVYACK